MTRAIIFDLFDVIISDPYNSWLAAHGLKRTGPYFDASYQQDLGNITFEQFLKRLSDLIGHEVTAKDFQAAAKLNPEVVKLVKVLQGKYKLALLSNAPSSFFRSLLAKNSLEQYFDEIVVSSEVGSVKPSLDIFHLTLERLKAKPDEAIFIDDNPSHVEAGERAGIRSLLFTSVEQLAEDFANLGIIHQ